MTIFKKIKDLLDKENIDNILITGGGIIPEEDMIELKNYGIGQLFGPGTSIDETIQYINQWVTKNRGEYWIILMK